MERNRHHDELFGDNSRGHHGLPRICAETHSVRRCSRAQRETAMKRSQRCARRLGLRVDAERRSRRRHSRAARPLHQLGRAVVPDAYVSSASRSPWSRLRVINGAPATAVATSFGVATEPPSPLPADGDGGRQRLCRGDFASARSSSRPCRLPRSLRSTIRRGRRPHAHVVAQLGHEPVWRPAGTRTGPTHRSRYGLSRRRRCASGLGRPGARARLVGRAVSGAASPRPLLQIAGVIPFSRRYSWQPW